MCSTKSEVLVLKKVKTWGIRKQLATSATIRVLNTVPGTKENSVLTLFFIFLFVLFGGNQVKLFLMEKAYGFSYMCVFFFLWQQFLHWLPTPCLHLLHCWLTICPCLQVTYHQVPPQGKSLESSSTWFQQKKGIWWRQTALMMRSLLPRVFWWRLRSANLLPRSILVMVTWANYYHMKLSHLGIHPWNCWRSQVILMAHLLELYLEDCCKYVISYLMISFSSLLNRWRRCEIRPSASKTSHHFASPLSEPLESCLSPLSTVQWCPGQRLVSPRNL